MLKYRLRPVLEKFNIFPYQKIKTTSLFLNYHFSQTDKTIIPLPLQTNMQKIIGSIHVQPNAQILEEIDYKLALFKKKTGDIHVSYKIQTIPLLTPYYSYNPQFFTIDENEYINSSDIKIKKIVDTLYLKKSTIENMRLIYEYILSYLTYGNPIEGLYSYEYALSKRKVDCGGFCTLLASLLGASGIKTRFVSGFLILPKDKNNLSMHAWLEALLPDNKVIPLDPSIDWRRRNMLTSRYGGFGYVGSDRVIYSYGVDKKVKMDNKILNLSHIQCPISM